MARIIFVLVLVQIFLTQEVLLYGMDCKYGWMDIFVTLSNESESVSANATEEFFLLPGAESPCMRPCQAGSVPLVCRYKFVVEWYQTMSRACYDCPMNLTDCRRPQCIPADGVSRPVLVVNRQMPGPSIQV